MDTHAITDAMTVYFDGIHHSDVGKLEQVFHPKAIYACATDGTLLYKTMDEYFPIVAARTSPASKGEARTDAIVSIDFAGPVTANVRATCSIAPKHFTDLLTFIYVDGQWRIISKVFHYDLA
jgi:4-oxalocrotonate tautomerase